MAETVDLDWFSFDLAEGQHLVLNVNWGAEGDGRAEAMQTVFGPDGEIIAQIATTAADWAPALAALGGDVEWFASGADHSFDAEFTWVGVGENFALVDPQGLDAAALGRLLEGDDGGAGGGTGADFLAGGEVVFGGEISLGDVLIGGAGQETYRITGENAGDTVTILGFDQGDHGSVLDISDLLIGGGGSLDVSYDLATQSSIVTVSGGSELDTVIIVQGVDLTGDLDAYLVTHPLI